MRYRFLQQKAKNSAIILCMLKYFHLKTCHTLLGQTFYLYNNYRLFMVLQRITTTILHTFYAYKAAVLPDIRYGIVTQ